MSDTPLILWKSHINITVFFKYQLIAIFVKRILSQMVTPQLPGEAPCFLPCWCSTQRKLTVQILRRECPPHPPTASLQGALYLAGIFTGFSLLRSAMHGCEKGGFSYSPKTEGLPQMSRVYWKNLLTFKGKQTNN